MPELPEVETIRRGLEKLVVGKKIKSISSDNPKSFPNAEADVDSFIREASVIDVRRRAKVLMIDMTSGYSLVIHLKMTGQLVFVGEQRWGGGHPTNSLVHALPDRSTRVIFEFSDGSHLYFNDQRKFGWIKLYPTIEIPNIDFMQKVGPEPLEDSFSNQIFIERVRKRNNTTIKAAILDQTTLAGVGNIYADESLWGACIHPASRVKNINDEQLSLLFEQIKKVLVLSIEKGGSTDKNYIDAEGRRGSYLSFASVFRRQGQSCKRCDNMIEKIRVAGRGTHICQVCQRIAE